MSVVQHPDCGREHAMRDARVPVLCAIGLWIGFVFCRGQALNVYVRGALTPVSSP